MVENAQAVAQKSTPVYWAYLRDLPTTVKSRLYALGLYLFKGRFYVRTIGRTIESCDSGLISRGAYNRDFTVYETLTRLLPTEMSEMNVSLFD